MAKDIGIYYLMRYLIPLGSICIICLTVLMSLILPEELLEYLVVPVIICFVLAAQLIAFTTLMDETLPKAVYNSRWVAVVEDRPSWYLYDAYGCKLWYELGGYPMNYMGTADKIPRLFKSKRDISWAFKHWKYMVLRHDALFRTTYRPIEPPIFDEIAEPSMASDPSDEERPMLNDNDMEAIRRAMSGNANT